MIGGFVNTITYDYKATPIVDGDCFKLMNLRVELIHEQNEIEIATEVPATSCLFRETVDHEKRHYALAVKFAPILEQRIRKALLQLKLGSEGPIVDQHEANALMQKQIEDTLEKERRSYIKWSGDEQFRLIDTEDDDELLERNCPGAADAFSRAYKLSKTISD
jgi:hypothetical protein